MLNFILAIQVISSLACFIFLVLKLRLNGYVKSLLSIMLLCHLICACGVLTGRLFFEGELRCRISRAFGFPMVGTYPMSSLISMLRFYMAKLASEAKLAKRRHVIPFIILGTITLYGYIAILPFIKEKLGYRTHFEWCKKEQEYAKLSSIAFIAIVLLYLGVCLAGLVCDLLMYKFVKGSGNQNIPGSNLVPWKSGTVNTAGDLQVPIRATILSFASAVLATAGIAFSYFVFLDFSSPQDLTYYGAMILSTACSSLPIFLVIFTVKHQAKIQASQPPNVLQFHEQIPPQELQFHEEIELQDIEIPPREPKIHEEIELQDIE